MAATATVTRLHAITGQGRQAWDEEVRSYLQGRRLAGLSAHTLRSYADSLARWARFMEEDGRDLHPDQATHQDAVAFMESLAQAPVLRRPTPGRKGATASTIVQRHRGVSLFFRWYADQPGVTLAADPFARVPRPRLEEEVVSTVSTDTWGTLLATTAGRSFTDVRDRAVLLLLADTGARRGEAAAIREEDLDLATMRVVLRGKTGTRTAAFGATTAQALQAYRRVRKAHPWAAEVMLVGDDGSRRESGHPLFLADPTSGHVSGFGGSGIASMLRRRCAQAGVPAIHPHQLRHTWAASAKAMGWSDVDLMVSGGWRSMDMVVRYGKADQERTALANYRSPVDNVLQAPRGRGR
jgi:site-specific recombinase XerD